jgi:prepilin-type N-terminal cleavage/methylation domain-containing protein
MSPRRVPRTAVGRNGSAGRRRRGFTLIETLIALTLIAIALLLGVALLLQQPRVVRRVDAERAAMRAIEATLESIRAGTVPLASERLEGFALQGDSAPPDLAVGVEVVPADQPSLYQVTLSATYTIYGRPVLKRVDTLVWHP